MHVYLMLSVALADATESCAPAIVVEVVAPPPATEPEQVCEGSYQAGEDLTTGKENTNPAKNAIFDPPTKAEMEEIAKAMQAYDFAEDAGEEITLTVPSPTGGRLPKVDNAEIVTLFPDGKFHTAKATPDGKVIWGGIQTCYISRIDTLPIAKADALAYLDGSGAKPGRYAKVNVAFGCVSNDNVKFVEYKVGPVESDNSAMTVTKIANQLWGSRPREGNEMHALKNMVDLILNTDGMKALCTESFDGQTHGAGLNNHEPAPPGLVGNERTTQILINFAVAGTWRAKDLNLVPLSFTINNTDVDPSMWTADLFYYNGQGPFTYETLMAGYTDGSIEKIVITGHEAREAKSFPQKRGNMRDGAELPGPQIYMPAGNRYSVNGRTVTWMKWKFHVGYTFRAGPDFHDISFNGERIAYQVALNEVGLIYSANDPVAGNVFFLDSTFGNGEYRELMRGIDCPDYATYLTNYWWIAPAGSAWGEALRSTCVFETWTGRPLWRRGGPLVSGMKDHELQVRFAMPNGNYDYLLTYHFKLDGTMRVEAESTGFIQTHFWSPSRGSSDSMAYKVSEYVGGSLHDHTYGFKVDLDVVSKANSFQTIEYKMSDTLTALNEGREPPLEEVPPYLLFPKMRYVKRTTVQNENDARLSINPATPKTWIIGDASSLNAHGNMRAYKIALDQTSGAVVDDDHYTMPAFSYAKQHVSVTQYKDAEATLSGPYDLNRMDDPQEAFDRIVDGESIVQEDIVAWVTLTALHLPTSENMPMTNAIKHGFTLSPFNFFDENPSMDLPHYLRLMPGEAPQDMLDSGNYEEDEPSFDQCKPKVFDTTHGFNGVF